MAKKYDVLSPLKRNETIYAPGDPIELENKDAGPLLDCETIGVPGSYKKSLETVESLEVKNEKLIIAIALVQKENANLKEQLSGIAKGKGAKGKEEVK